MKKKASEVEFWVVQIGLSVAGVGMVIALAGMMIILWRD